MQPIITARPITEDDAKEIAEVMRLLQEHLVGREAGLVMVVLQGMVANGVLAFTEGDAEGGSGERAEAIAAHIKLFITGTLAWLDTYLAERYGPPVTTAEPSTVM